MNAARTRYSIINGSKWQKLVSITVWLYHSLSARLAGFSFILWLNLMSTFIRQMCVSGLEHIQQYLY